MHRSLIVFALVSLACGREASLGSVDPSGVETRGTRLPVEPKNACTVAFGGPDCCGTDGHRVGGSTCVDNEYVCTVGAVCGCGGQAQTFHCSDFCGSDAYVSPVCGPDGWVCEAGLIATSSCPANTCWGDPGELCLSPRCVDGHWACDGDDGGVHDPI